MGLPHVVDSIIADFADSNVTCPIYYGPDHEAEHNDAPRIVIYPTDDSYGPPSYVQQAEWPAGDMSNGQNPRPIATRTEGAKAILWAVGTPQIKPGTTEFDYTTQQRADYEALHALINQFILSLHKVQAGNYQLLGGTTTKTTRADRRGYVYTLDFTVQVPIIDTPWFTETTVAQGTTVQMTKTDDSVINSVTIPQ